MDLDEMLKMLAVTIGICVIGGRDMSFTVQAQRTSSSLRYWQLLLGVGGHMRYVI